MPMEEVLTMTVEQAARALGIGRGLAYEAVRRGEIPSLRVGRRILVPRRALEKLLQEGVTRAEEAPFGGGGPSPGSGRFRRR